MQPALFSHPNCVLTAQAGVLGPGQNFSMPWPRGPGVCPFDSQVTSKQNVSIIKIKKSITIIIIMIIIIIIIVIITTTTIVIIVIEVIMITT